MSFVGTFKSIGSNLQSHWKRYIQYALAIFFIFFAIHFFSSQGDELKNIQTQIAVFNRFWLWMSILITLLFVVLQGVMYQYAFKSIQKRIPLLLGINLFLKRNFVSVFLPAGGITSLAFFNKDILRQKISKSESNIAASIYAFLGILSVVIVGIPIIIYALCISINIQNIGALVLLLIGMIVVLCYFIWDLKKQKFLYKILIKYFPKLENSIHSIFVNEFDKKSLYITLVISILIDIIGIFQLYFVMKGLAAFSNLFIASLAYIIVVILLIVSPFLRGVGAIEVSLAYILGKFGYSRAEALGITLLFRFFEFWFPLFLGAIAFLVKVDKFIIRILPSCFALLLGIINIYSVLTPPIITRFELENSVLSLKTMTTSNYFVLMAGLFLILNAFLLLKGSKTAFVTAIALCIVSIVGNLLKSLDYEEAFVGLVVLITLVISAKDYRAKSKFGISNHASQLILLSCAIVLVYGYLGLYFLNFAYWHIHLNFFQVSSLLFKSIFMLKVKHGFLFNKITRYFFYSLSISSFSVIIWILVLLLRPKYLKINESNNANDLILAKDLLFRMHDSANDFFKIWNDKQIYFSQILDGFVSYKSYKNYVVVLENPVISDKRKLHFLVEEFENYCRLHNLKPFYYRVSAEFVNAIETFKKKKLLIGQEAILDLGTFSLTGKSMKSIRNAINNAQRNGLTVTTNLPPIKDGLLQQLVQVSDQWLDENNRKEIGFSQGSFDWDILKNQTILTVENKEGMVLAFVNILPTFGQNIATYDLIRYIPNAPNGTIDFLLVETFNYLKANGLQFVDIGFAPFSGLNEIDVKNFLEMSIKFTHEKIKPIADYQQGLRKSKEKFGPNWENKYLVYNEDFDLLQFPIVYRNIIKV
ncbi:phosphatidylglycerol lysyltransferase domain-containing protein [Rhizosphaericola mali]|uniref:Phosphatidylglycerol lysyltransferase n=1 Tax=Rhizosphaericola mali TaxID=2545455 RepID=A0A5P2G6B1_9BACT|nr:phosphatidylglycerol lysyltransferase domain-containing protein [Rhizosphaericola mali]QES90847.1 DUF2156 domain-containing protein [Rhizosphaericola mali]